MLHKLAAIGGDGQLFQTVQGAQLLEQLANIPSYQGFAPRYPQLGNPQPNKHTGYSGQLLQCEHIPARQKGHILGHAVGAAEVTAIGHRQPDVVDTALEAVDQGCGSSFLHRGSLHFPGSYSVSVMDQ